jgi:predicted transposase YdaD
MPERITEYFGFSLSLLVKALREGFRPACVVLYLERRGYREDPGRFDLEGELGFRLFTSYQVLKLWEMPPDLVLRMDSPGLCPFVPLMAGKPEDLMLRSVQRIREAPESAASREQKRLLLLALRALSSRVIQDMSIIESILSDPEFMAADPFYKKGQREGIEEGEQRGQSGAILGFLSARFGAVPEDIRTRVLAVRGREELRRLVIAAAQAKGLEEFCEELDRES